MGESEKYVETFRQEAEELLINIEEIVLAIEEDPNDRSNIDQLFRSMHTIKGSGAMFGFEDVAAFTHHVETVLDRVRAGLTPVSKELIDLILASRDQITIMMNATNGGPAADEDVTQSIVARLGVLLSDGSATSSKIIESSDQIESASESDQEREISYTIKFWPDPAIFMTGMDPVLLLDELRELGECIISADVTNVPPLDVMHPEGCYLGWNIVLRTSRGMDAIKDVFIFVEDTSKIEIAELPADATDNSDEQSLRLGEILLKRGQIDPGNLQNALGQQKRVGEILVESGAVSQHAVDSALSEQQHAQEKQKSAAQTESLRVPSDKLDALVNLVGELVINQARLTQVSGYIDNSELELAVEEVERLTGDLRDIVLTIRMTPIGTMFGRFKRLVRDLSSELGKEIDLITDGAETELDKTVIDRLADPLVHLIRNSIDHGIESPELRERSGKPRRGTVSLAAVHMGTNVVISITDDGSGLDADVIRHKAIEKGLISSDEELSEQDIYSLIFLPGFSTASKVTSVSGRGVGMDVVRREIDALRGSIKVSSTNGHGTKIDLSLPLTLAIIDGLLVEVDTDRFVVPLSMVEECLELTSDRLALSKERNVIQLRGEAIPFISLRDVFKIPGIMSGLAETVVVNAGGFRVGLVVDHVIGDHQTVIKSLGRSYKDVEGVSGATILGDGSVALILEVSELIKCASEQETLILAA